MRLRYKLLVASIPLLIVSVLGLTFSVQAKSENTYMKLKIDNLEAVQLKDLNDITYLKNRVAKLEDITSPPKVNVLSEELSFNDVSIAISKLVIEDLGLNTVVRTVITNKSDYTRTFVISNRKATRVLDGYTELDINSPYVVVPLTSSVEIDPGDSKPIVILVSKLDSSTYNNTEAWIGVMARINDKVKSEVVLRILIKGTS